MDAPLVRIAIAVFLALAVPVSAGERLAGRARVTEGDTISIGGVAVRLKGLAAPEVAHFGDPGEPGSAAAKAFMVELVEGQTVVCDLTQERSHGRRVGYCYPDSADIAEALVRAGLARNCPRFSGGQYAVAQRQQHVTCRFRVIACHDKEPVALRPTRYTTQKAGTDAGIGSDMRPSGAYSA